MIGDVFRGNRPSKKTERENAGKPWTEEEEKHLIDEYHEGLKVKDMDNIHGRSNGAITSKLAKLNLSDK